MVVEEAEGHGLSFTNHHRWVRQPMKSARSRWLLVSLGLLALFTSVVLLIIALLPRPLSRADYFVAGSVATLLVLLAVFVLLLAAWLRAGGRWPGRRRS